MAAHEVLKEGPNPTGETETKGGPITQVTVQDAFDAVQEIKGMVKSLVALYESHEAAHRGEPWATVASETTVVDQARAKKWNKDIDTLLLYASLFSAVVATFAVESVKGQEVSATTDPSPETRGSSAHTSLWFVSLILALITASAGTLVKQWIQQYLEEDFDSSPREHSRMRQHRYDGLERWRVLFFIGLLPVLLRISFVLFGAGLAIRLNDFDHTAAVAFSVLGVIWLFLSLSATALPSYYSNCPYKSPESLLMLNIVLLVKRRFSSALYIRGGSTSSIWRWESWQSRERRAVEKESRQSQERRVMGNGPGSQVQPEKRAAGVWGKLGRLIQNRPVHKTELEVQALVTACTELAPSNPSLAADIELCAQDFGVADVMQIVHCVGRARMRRTDIKPAQWQKLWNYTEHYTGSDQSVSNITKRGTKMLLKMIADAVQRDAENGIANPATACVATLLTRNDLVVEINLRKDIERAIARLLGAVRRGPSEGDIAGVPVENDITDLEDETPDMVEDEVEAVVEGEVKNAVEGRTASVEGGAASVVGDGHSGEETEEVTKELSNETLDKKTSTEAGETAGETAGTTANFAADEGEETDDRNTAFAVFLAAVGLCAQIQPDEGAFAELENFDFTPCKGTIRELLRSAIRSGIFNWVWLKLLDPSATAFILLRLASLSPSDAALEHDLREFFSYWAGYFAFSKLTKRYQECSPWASKVVAFMKTAHFNGIDTDLKEHLMNAILAFSNAE